MNMVSAVALSITANQGSLKVWSRMRDFTPDELMDLFQKRYTLKTQKFIEDVYNSNPMKSAEIIIDSCNKNDFHIISFWHENYPPLLREIACPPPVLFSTSFELHQKCISVVGSRKIDHRMKSVTRKISKELCNEGYTVVSGMAMGADREAHMGALDAGGPTIGVLANGIDITYPSSNRDLYSLIKNSSSSSLISEYPPGCVAGKWTFVKRNRIISGLSEALVITHAGAKSGALITAGYALEQNRDIFACPGAAYDDSTAGTNKLIKDGARLIESSEDILEELSVKGTYKRKRNVPIIEKNLSFPFESETEETKKVLDYLGKGESSIDSIARSLEIPVSAVHEIVSVLEIEGIIQKNGNNIYRI